MLDQLWEKRQESLLQQFSAPFNIFNRIRKLIFKPDTGSYSIERLGNGFDLEIGTKPVVLDHPLRRATHMSVRHQCLPFKHTRIIGLDYFVDRSRIERCPVVHQQVIKIDIECNASKAPSPRAKNIFQFDDYWMLIGIAVDGPMII